MEAKFQLFGKAKEWLEERGKSKEEKRYFKLVEEFRAKIPDEYHQCDALDYLPRDIDQIIISSNRSDGKTSSWTHWNIFFFAIRMNMKPVVVTRTLTQRNGFIEDLQKIIRREGYDDNSYGEFRAQDYVELFWKNKEVALLTDLGSVKDTKHYSAVLSKYDFLFVDEFLVDNPMYYFPDEERRMEILFGSIDKKFDEKRFKPPFIIYCTNPGSLSSPILLYINHFTPNVDVFEALATAPMNSITIEDNLLIHKIRNDKVNEKRNLRAFGGDLNTSNMTSGEFEFNPSFLIKLREFKRLKLESNYYEKIVKGVHGRYISITKIQGYDKLIMQVHYHKEKYDYCTILEDVMPKVTYLNERFFSERNKKKFERGSYQFTDPFSRTYVMDNYPNLNFHRLMNETFKEKKPEEEEKDIHEFQIETTRQKQLERIAQQFETTDHYF